MRIAFITTEFVTEANTDGGLANYLLRTCLLLKQSGHEPVIFVFSDKDEIIDYKGIQVNRVEIRKKPDRLNRFWLKLKSRKNIKYLYPRLVSSWLINQALKKAHKTNPFDIVQYTNINGIGYFRPKNIPAVTRLSSFRRKWLKAYDMPIDKKLEQIIWIEERSLTKVNEVYSPSLLVSSLVNQNLGINVKVIRPPFQQSTTKLDNSWYSQHLKEKQYLLFFGRLGPMKGLYSIGAILEQVLDEYPDLYFAFIGSESGYTDRCHQQYLIDAAGKHADRIIISEKQDKESLYPVIQNAKGIVLPSLIDNIPNTCLESMASGKIVIGTKGASFDEIIKDGHNGLLCKIDNPESLLKKIHQLMALNSEQYEQMQTAAKNSLTDFLPENAITELLAFYNKVISNS